MSLSTRLRVTIDAVNKTREDFQEIENGIERLSKARQAASRVVLEEQRAQQFLSQAYRAQHQQFMDSISVMRNVGSIGRGLLSMWQAYTIGQMNVSQSLDRVEEAQIRVNTALELYGENSVVYLDAVSDLEKLEEAADAAKGNEAAGLIGLGLTAVGVAAQVGTLMVQLELIETIALAGGYVIPVVVALAGLAAVKEAIEYLQTTAQVAAGEVAPGATAADFPAGYIPGEYLGIGETTGFDPIPAEMAFDPSAPGWQGGLMRPSGPYTFTQINYGVEGAGESFQRFRDMFDEIFNNEDE